MSNVIIILPSHVQKQNVTVVDLLHPRTGQKCKFLKSTDAIYEITSIDGNLPHSKSHGTQKAVNEARGILFTHGYVKSDASILVASPINPLFFTLRILYQHAIERYITIENMEDYMETQAHKLGKLGENVEILPSSYYSHILDRVCSSKIVSTGSMGYQLLPEKLITYLDTIRERTLLSLPKSLIKKHVDQLIAPVDVNEEAPSHIREAALDRLAVLLISTYLSADLTNLFIKSRNFDELNQYIAEVKSARELAQETQRALSEREAPGIPAKPKLVVKRKALQRKPVVADKMSRKITDMFGIKAKTV